MFWYRLNLEFLKFALFLRIVMRASSSAICWFFRRRKNCVRLGSCHTNKNYLGNTILIRIPDTWNPRSSEIWTFTCPIFKWFECSKFGLLVRMLKSKVTWFVQHSYIQTKWGAYRTKQTTVCQAYMTVKVKPTIVLHSFT